MHNNYIRCKYQYICVMPYQALKDSLRGVAVTPATPFSEDRDEVRYEKLRSNARFLVAAGIPVVLPCGNTGEYYSLSVEERVKIVRETVDEIGGDAAVIGGVGGSTKDVLRTAEQYETAGADGLMLMDPSHTFIHEQALLDYYERIAEETDLGLVLYKRGPELTSEALIRLAEIENVVAIKYATNDVSEFSKVVESSSADVVWSTGIAERYAPAFSLEGAQGFTSGIGNFIPEVPLAMMDAIREGDWERVKRVRAIARPYEDLREAAGEDNSIVAANNVPAVKFGMELAGLYGGPVREPIRALSESDQENARRYYDEMKDQIRQLT